MLIWVLIWASIGFVGFLIARTLYIFDINRSKYQKHVNHRTIIIGDIPLAVISMIGGPMTWLAVVIQFCFLLVNIGTDIDWSKSIYTIRKED